MSARRGAEARARRAPLARFLLVLYVLLTVYASLYPWTGWRAPAGSTLDFLFAPWPRWVTRFDVAVNVLGYVPYGLLCALAVYPALGRVGAALLALATGGALSLGMESAQAWLPARVASNLDLLANACGAAAGGFAGAWLAPWLLDTGPLRRLRASLVAPGTAADVGLALLGLWLFAQLNPATLAFGAGDLRDYVADTVGQVHGATLFVAIEAATAAANLVAVALLASAVLRPDLAPARLRLALVALLAAALAVKTLAAAILMKAEHVLAWLTPGAQLGLAAGLAAALAALALPRVARLALAAVLLMAATVLVNLAPPNPYLADTLRVWSQGHFLHFNGLTRLVSSAWPFAALAWLMVLATGRERARGA